jgi:hypothetical protein
MRWVLLGAAVFLSCFALAACSDRGGDSTLGEGLSEGTDTVKLQVATFVTALSEGEWKRACGKLTPEYLDKLGGEGACARYWRNRSKNGVVFFGETFEAGRLGNLDLEVSRQSGDVATVTGPDEEQRVRLKRTSEEGWQIDSIEPLPAG